MRRPMIALVSAFSVCLSLTGCGGKGVNDTATTSTPTKTARPLGEGALNDLLLKADQINVVMGAEEMAATNNRIAMSDDADTMEPRECLAIDAAAQAQVYDGSGFTALRDVTFAESDDFAHYAQEAVILFPTAKHARTFFDKQAEQWGNCREYRHPQSGTEWTPGKIANANAILSTVATQTNGPPEGWACGRALAVRNNIIVDVNTCSADPGESALQIAVQIAGKIRT